jgi:hypothetical protein
VQDLAAPDDDSNTVIMRHRLVRHPDRDHWLRRIEQLDPLEDYQEITEISSTREFPWDVTQALSFALFRTYAVPSIGVLLYETGEFTERTQKRYDDTALILDTIAEHGLDSATGRAALRRMNQMHAMYDISQADLRYVLCTFVATPIRWLDEYGWRPLTEIEKVATATYYRELGRHMGIKDIPKTWWEFGAHMDAYEAEHFGYDVRAAEVAQATLKRMATFPPNNHAPARSVIRSSYAFMDEPLLDSFHFPHPTAAERAAVRAAMAARAAWLRRQPPRMQPIRARDLPQVRGYPNGFDVTKLGTFHPTGG